MDDLGTEVGQKMRSAVKAKLIELGTGGSAGYIDDELPDYVMIMVANKRSKQQMIGDLNLFLGSNTDLFVTWLHEVLQKLQEVTLPANVMQKAKRKTNETDSLPITKKEKKDKKRDKKSKRNEKQYDEISGTSISDVFADHILHNAKKTMEIEADAKIKQKNEISPRTTDEFDIPTITEISEQQKQTDHNDNSSIRKDLTELAEIQKKIYQAKRQLKAIETDESEDEDFLNINDGEEFLEDVADKANKRNHKVKSPIIFDSDMTTTTTVTTTVTTLAPATITETPTPLTPIKNSEINENSNILEQEKMKKRITITFNNEEERRRSELRRETQQSESSPILAVSPVSLHKKRSIHERLGIKSILTPNSSKHSENVISLSTHRRIEKEIYVPVFRRKEFDKDQEKDRERDRDRDRDYVRDRERDRERDVRGRSREYQDKNKDEKISIRKRIGSRVIVAPPKPEYNDDEDDVIDRPVSSMIKVKPRPPISPSKQANKNLLLRAVAEAQKSTALFKPKKDRAPSLSPPSSTQQQSLRSQKLYSKSYRNRNREAILKRAIKDNIVIEVNSEKIPSTTISSRINKLNDDEYIPEPISDRGDSDTDYIYVPQIINSGNSDDENMSYDDELINNRNQTQFVVTLDDKSRDNFVSTLEENLNEMQIEKIDNNKTNNINSIITTTTTTTRSTSTITTGTGIQLRKPQNNQQKIKIIPEKRKDIINYRTDYKQDVKKLIIKNDTDDEMMGLEDKTTIEDIETNNKDITINNNNNNNTNDNKNDNVKDQIEERSTTPPLPKKPISSSENKIQFSPLKKRKRSTVSPIKFDLNVNEDNDGQRSLKRRSKSDEPDSSKKPNETYNKDDRNEDNHKVQTKKPDGYKKYDNIPQLLSSVSVESVSVKNKTKERCKYYPQCGKGDTCEFFHPSTPCKAFPNCKFVDKCLYLHPKCKFDLTCKRIVCNFSHSSMPAIQTSAPPLSSHVVPVQNYKTITPSLLPALCKFYPNCTNSACSFYHPKLCRFGKNCMNKVECNFYHHDLPNKDKFKWVASLG